MSFKQVKWNFVFDNALKILNWVSRITAILGIVTTLLYAAFLGTKTGSVAGFCFVMVIGIIVCAIFVVIYLFLDRGYDKFFDWLTSKFSSNPELRRWIVVPLTIILSITPYIIIMNMAMGSIQEYPTKALILLGSTFIACAFNSLVQDEERLRLSRRMTELEKHMPPSVPFLTDSDLDNTLKMAQLYFVLHCYENSVRKLIEQVFATEFGPDWWNKVATKTMQDQLTRAKAREEKNKWTSTKGDVSALYYLYWSQLEELISNHPLLFKPHNIDVGFVKSRFGDLSNLRNLVAHNGLVPLEDDFIRAGLSLRDWTRQVEQKAGN